VQNQKLKDKLAFVTGGARGIGRETCLALAEWGADLVVSDIDAAGAEATAKEASAKGVKAEGLKLDVSSVSEIQKTLKEVAKKYGRIDIIVNSAGIGPTTPVLDIDEEHWNRVMDINIKGTFFVCQEAIRIMLEKQIPGRIVNLASMAGESGGRAISADYSVTKGGVIALTKTLARHFGAYNILVNAVAPGVIETEMTKEWRAKSLKEIPMKRFGDPREVATVIRFLVSDDASYVNGEVVRINGGQYL
jgi:3-oxoacyl-[acyl-carrier protein] reductase